MAHLGFCTSLNLLLVVGTLMGQILASPLPLSADNVMLYEPNSSSGISSGSSLFNCEQLDSEFAPLNKRIFKFKFRSDELLLGLSFLYWVSLN